MDRAGPDREPDPHEPVIREHLSQGGTCFVLELVHDESHIVRRTPGGDEPVLALEDIPATRGGRIRTKCENALFAAAIASCLGVDLARVAAGLSTYGTDFAFDFGRLTFVPGYPFQVVMDRATDPDSMREAIAILRALPVSGRRIAEITVPGNRTEKFLLDTMRQAGGMDLYHLTDWEDLRGKEPGVTPAILARGLAEAGVPPERIVSEGFRGEVLGDLAGRLAPGICC